MAAGTGALADSGQISSGTAGLVHDTLNSADSDILGGIVRCSTAMLSGNHDAGSLTAITSWAPAQITAMRTIVRTHPGRDDAAWRRRIHTWFVAAGEAALDGAARRPRLQLLESHPPTSSDQSPARVRAPRRRGPRRTPPR